MNSLTGSTGSDSLYGGAGNDTLAGGAGADSLDGGAGTDMADYSASGAAVTVNLAAGTGLGGDAQGDTLTSIEQVTGSGYSDSLTGTSGNDSLYGGAGNDTLVGGAGADSLDGGSGTDMADYSASGAAVTVNLATGTGAGGDAQGDTLTSIEQVTGSNYNDSLTGDAGANLLIGGLGNDTLTGGAGADSLYGGTGMDYADYSASSAGVSVNLSDGTASGGDAQGDVLSGIDGLIGSASNDTLIGFDGQGTTPGDLYTNVIYGGAGNDYIDGRGGDDSLYGGSGNDTIIGGSGADLIDGGSGTDMADYSGSGAGVTVNLATGTGLGGDAQGDTLTGIEQVRGSAYNDSLTGTAGNDSLYGGAGNDTLAGGAGADSLDGGSGQNMADYSASAQGVSVNLGTGAVSGGDAEGDTLTNIQDVTGSGQADALTGTAGANMLYGGAGDDTIIGGGGADQIFAGSGNDSIVAGTGAQVDGGSGTDTLDVSHQGALRIVYDVNNHLNGTVEYLDSNNNVTGTLTFQNIEKVVACFTPGTMIDTDQGRVAIEALQIGDRVLTRDNGYCPIRWIGQQVIGGARLRETPSLQPILISQGALGYGLPERDMLVSRQHRMLFTSTRAELLFGECEVLAKAVHLTEMPGIAQVCLPEVTYIHVMFDRHEIILADGAWSESFQPSDRTMEAFDEDQRRELEAIFPGLTNGAVAEDFDSARLTLRAHETRILTAA